MAGEGQSARVRVRLKGSEVGSTQRERPEIRGPGLPGVGDARVLVKTTAVLGMIEKVAHLLEAEEANGAG